VLIASPLWRLADAYRQLPAERKALVYRVGLAIVVGLTVYVLIELAWDLVVATGHCTGCPPVGDDLAGVGGAAAAGGAGAAGSRDAKPPKDWLGDAMDSDRPPRPSTPITPEEEAEWVRNLESWKVPGAKPGSPAETWNRALDNVINFTQSDDHLGSVESMGRYGG